MSRLGFVQVEPWMHESGSREFIRAKILRKWNTAIKERLHGRRRAIKKRGTV